jgi:hypothetical protein
MNPSVEEIREVIAEYKPFIPLVEEILDEAAPILDKVFGRLMQYMREQTMKSLQYYQSEGLSLHDAMLLTINGNIALADAVKNIGNNKQK